MRRARLRGFQDYLALFVRRRWWVLVTFMALAALTVLTALLFPRIYRSETVILIQPRDMPTEFVKDLIAGSTDQRLSVIEQTILSRSNLGLILGQFEERLQEFRNLNDERKIAKLKKRIQIQPATERRNGAPLPITTLRISYKDRDAELAQAITSRLSSLFIEQDNQARQTQVATTTDFLAGELNKIEEKLKTSENRINVLKEGFQYELPEERQTNLRTLDRLQLQRNSTLEALDRDRAMQMTLERQLSETPQTILTQPAKGREVSGMAARDPEMEKYLNTELELKKLRAKVTAIHPDVQRLERELEQLKKDIPPEELAAARRAPADPATPAVAPNPIYLSLVAQLSQLKTEIEIRTAEREKVEAEMARLNQRIQTIPGAEREMSAALRENADLARQHEDLKGKLEQARLAESLENRQRGAQFVIVEPADYPQEPITPGKASIVFFGLAISLAAGFAVAWVVDGLRPRIWTQRELERFLETKALVEIPALITPTDLIRQRRRRLMQAVLVIVLAGVYAGGLYYLYLKQAALLRLLDPVIEKISERIAS